MMHYDAQAVEFSLMETVRCAYNAMLFTSAFQREATRIKSLIPSWKQLMRIDPDY
jgi:hypothetical protein